MASGRVGGTRSKIRGQVGDVVYQVKRNPDGTYTQISYGKAEDVTQTITPRGQAQRMCTSMVEAMMRDLKDVARISMQSAANKSKSLNAFSSYNLRLVAQDCQAHWNSGNRFFYPPTSFRGTPYEALGGVFMISSGTGQFDVFDECIFSDEPWKIWARSSMLTKFFSGVRWDIKPSSETVAEFLRRHFMTILDEVYFVYFCEWQEYNPDEESWDPRTGYFYIKVTINPSVDQSAILSREILDSLFIAESKRDIWKSLSDDGKGFYIGALFEQNDASETCPFLGAFTVSYIEGKKKITSHSLRSWDDTAEAYLLNYAPADVFGTWMGTPRVKPYPSPFTPSPTPVPTPRLPNEYQEVEWISKNVSTNWSIPHLWCAPFTILSGKIKIKDLGVNRIWGNSSGVGRMTMGLYSMNNEPYLRLYVYDTDSVLSRFVLYKPSVNDIVEFVWQPNDIGFIFTTNHGVIEDDSIIWPSTFSKIASSVGGTLSDSRNFIYWEIVGRDRRDRSLMFDLVPCYRKENALAGLYDLVSNQFLTCANQVADFTCGPNVVY